MSSEPNGSITYEFVPKAHDSTIGVASEIGMSTEFVGAVSGPMFGNEESTP